MLLVFLVMRQTWLLTSQDRSLQHHIEYAAPLSACEIRSPLKAFFFLPREISITTSFTKERITHTCIHMHVFDTLLSK